MGGYTHPSPPFPRSFPRPLEFPIILHSGGYKRMTNLRPQHRTTKPSDATHLVCDKHLDVPLKWNFESRQKQSITHKTFQPAKTNNEQIRTRTKHSNQQRLQDCLVKKKERNHDIENANSSSKDNNVSSSHSDQNHPSTSSSTTTASPSPNNGDPSTSTSTSSTQVQQEEEASTSQVQEEEMETETREEEREREQGGEGEEDEDEENQERQQEQQSRVVYVPNTIQYTHESNDDAWSCLIVLVTFWFFASMTLILGLYGSSSLQLGPYCSELLQSNSFFVKEIQVEELSGPKHGMMLYGFSKTPPLDVDITWSEGHKAYLQPEYHKEWVYFLNEGSQVDINYGVDSQSSYPLSLVIAQGKESFIEWIEDPSYPNLTLSWNIITGNGSVQQKIYKSTYYYVAVGNLNQEDVEVQLSVTIQALVYNTTTAYTKCSLANGACGLNLNFLGSTVAVLTSPGPDKDTISDDWYVKLSYEPRWISYLVGSGAMTILILLVFKFCTKFQAGSYTSGFQADEWGSERAPLLTHKDDDLSSWGSSYDSVSHDEEDLEDLAAVSEAKPLKDGENNPRRLCIICFDAPRDCFFLPCGHCAACFTCGTRIVEEGGNCPICRRKMKKVRKIFAV